MVKLKPSNAEQGALVHVLETWGPKKIDQTSCVKAIIESFESPPTVPGDRLLSYRTASCNPCGSEVIDETFMYSIVVSWPRKCCFSF